MLMGHLKIISLFLAKEGLFPIQGFWYNGQKHIDDIDLIATLGQICGIIQPIVIQFFTNIQQLTTKKNVRKS